MRIVLQMHYVEYTTLLLGGEQMREEMRTDFFSPYRPGKGPEFKLILFDTGRVDHRGCGCIAYELYEGTARFSGKDKLLFSGDDFYGSPLHAIDSDESMRSLLSFLTLRPGDTDPSYFEHYTAGQREFCDQHAEALSMFSIDPEEVKR